MAQESITKTGTVDITSQLINALVKRSLVESCLIEELIENRDKAVDLARKQIQGKCYFLDYYEKKLKIFDTYSKEELYSIPLPGEPTDFNPSDFDDWGNCAVIFNNDHLQKEGEIPYINSYNYGIVLKDNKSYLYNPDIDRQNLLGLTNTYIFGSIPKKPKTNLPFDMYFSEDYSHLCITNRDEGKIYIFDVNLSVFRDEISIRTQGSTKTINIAISALDRKLYITDSITPILSIYDLNTKSLTKKNLNIGILGNICLSSDEKSLYIVVMKPEQSLKNIDINKLTEIKNFPIKGELFTIGDAPCDLLTLSPDKKHLFLMTFINDPNPFTPVISVFDTEKNKPIKRFSIKDESKPINLCFEDINPVGSVNKTIEDMLIENKLFSINKLRDLKNAILNGEEESFDAAEENENFIQVEGEDLEFELRKDHDPNSTGVYSGVVPKRINHIFIPKKANKHIKECLADSFWLKHEIDLREIPEVQVNLDSLVEKIRMKLEDYDLEVVEIKAFYDKKLALEGVILREFILEMLDEEESENRKQIKTVPTNCPNCSAPLLGAWDCATCGFEIEKPEDAIKRKIASVDPLANLAKGNMLLVDTSKGELFEIDSFKVPVWKTSKHQLDVKSITSAIRLENMNTLILDGIAGEIIEITPKGKVAKRLKIGEDEFPLNNPSFFSLVNYDHFLIADTDNHRVMETNHEGQIIWQYGSIGMSGLEPPLLNTPTYVQKTYDGTYLITDSGNNRIIELTRYLDVDSGVYKTKIIWEYGREKNIIAGNIDHLSLLNDPRMAQKDLVGNITILDYGNKRILEVTGEKKMNWHYYTQTKDESSSISHPEKFIRMKNKDIMVSGDGKYVQFMPSANNRIVWTSTRKEMALKTGFHSTVDNNPIKIKVKYGATPQIRIRVPKYEIRTPEELEKELEIIIAKKMMEATIAPPLWVDSEKPMAFLTSNKKVIPMPILIIDKVNNKIMMADREANVFWSYGDNKVEKLVRVKTANITPQKTILITNAKQLMEVTHDKLSDYYFQAERENNLSKNEPLISDVNERIWSYPCHAESAVKLNNGNILICESKKCKVIEITKENKIVWEYQHKIRNAIASYATRLINGNTLIAYSSIHIVVEVSPDHKIVWSFGEDRIAADDGKHLSFPEYVCRLDNGNTLIADTKNGRVIEVAHYGEILWECRGTDLIKLISPNYVMRLQDGNTFIVHGGNRELIEVDKKCNLMWKLVLPLQK